MVEVKNIVKKRLIVWFLSLIICGWMSLNCLNSFLMPRFITYGEYQCVNLITKILNISVNSQMNKMIEENMLIKSQDDNIIDFNVEVLNSVVCNIVNRSQQLFLALENGILDEKNMHLLELKNEDIQYLNSGIIYKIPFSSIFGNSLIGGLGFDIPIRYRFIGEISHQIDSMVEEYGINNALLKIELQVNVKTRILVPLITKEKEITTNVPLLVKAIQGKIPDYYLGTNVIGGTKK